MLQVTVTNGNRRKTFYIARRLIDQKAPHLNNSLGLYDFDPSESFNITDMSIETFELVVKWLTWNPCADHNDPAQSLLWVPCEPNSWYGLLSLT